MIDRKQELWDDLDQLRDYACTMKRAATDMLDWCHVIENDMQAFIEDYTGPSKFPDAEPEHPHAELLPMEQEFLPGSDCIDPDGEGCKCYVGCTADCLPSEYKSCKCPRKVAPPMTSMPEPDIKPQSDPTDTEIDDGVYTLTDKGRLIVTLIDEGHKYIDACRIADEIFNKE